MKVCLSAWIASKVDEDFLKSYLCPIGSYYCCLNCERRGRCHLECKEPESCEFSFPPYLVFSAWRKSERVRKEAKKFEGTLDSPSLRALEFLMTEEMRKLTGGKESEEASRA